MKSFHVQSCGIDTSANSLTKTSDQYHEFDIELDYPYMHYALSLPARSQVVEKTIDC